MLRDALEAVWGPPMFFEHGSSPRMIGSACITHAHLHAVPLAVDLMKSFERDGFDVSDLRAEEELDKSWRSVPYFMVEDQHGKAVIATPATPPPSQYLRRELGRAVGIVDPEWDWDVVVRRDLLRETVTRLRGVLG
jgi:hypothetical protein